MVLTGKRIKIDKIIERIFAFLKMLDFFFIIVASRYVF